MTSFAVSFLQVRPCASHTVIKYLLAHQGLWSAPKVALVIRLDAATFFRYHPSHGAVGQGQGSSDWRLEKRCPPAQSLSSVSAAPGGKDHSPSPSSVAPGQPVRKRGTQHFASLPLNFQLGLLTFGSSALLKSRLAPKRP